MRKLFSLSILGIVIIIALVAAVVLVDDVSGSRRAAMLVAVFGPAWRTLDFPRVLPIVYRSSDMGDLARCEVAKAY